MLPNHAPLQVAEQFGTLEALFPGRVDLGLGRAPGTDQAAAYAMRRNLASDAGQFPRDVVELMGYFRARERRPARARHPRRGPGHPGVDSRVEPVRRRTRGAPRAALRLRLALRAAADDRGARPLPRATSARRNSSTGLMPCSASTSSPPTATRRRSCSRPRSSRRSSPCAPASPASSSRRSRVIPTPFRPTARAMLDGLLSLLGDRRAGDGQGADRGVHRADRRRRTDDHLADLRPCGAGSLLRIARQCHALRRRAGKRKSRGRERALARPAR